jgi:hypothetical protein
MIQEGTAQSLYPYFDIISACNPMKSKGRKECRAILLFIGVLIIFVFGVVLGVLLLVGAWGQKRDAWNVPAICTVLEMEMDPENDEVFGIVTNVTDPRFPVNQNVPTLPFTAGQVYFFYYLLFAGQEVPCFVSKTTTKYVSYYEAREGFSDGGMVAATFFGIAFIIVGVGIMALYWMSSIILCMKNRSKGTSVSTAPHKNDSISNVQVPDDQTTAAEITSAEILY